MKPLNTTDNPLVLTLSFINMSVQVTMNIASCSTGHLDVL